MECLFLWQYNLTAREVNKNIYHNTLYFLILLLDCIILSCDYGICDLDGIYPGTFTKDGEPKPNNF